MDKCGSDHVVQWSTVSTRNNMGGVESGWSSKLKFGNNTPNQRPLIKPGGIEDYFIKEKTRAQKTSLMISQFHF